MMMRCINKKVLMEAWEREAGIGKGDEGNGGGDSQDAALGTNISQHPQITPVMRTRCGKSPLRPPPPPSPLLSKLLASPPPPLSLPSSPPLHSPSLLPPLRSPSLLPLPLRSPSLLPLPPIPATYSSPPLLSSFLLPFPTTL